MLGHRRSRSAAQLAPGADHGEPAERQAPGRQPKRAKGGSRRVERAPASARAATAAASSGNVPTFRISVAMMSGAVIAINEATAADTILDVKERVFAANRMLRVRRQRLVYTAGPRGMEPLPNDETLGGAGVAQDGSAVLDVLLVDLTAAEVSELSEQLAIAASDGRKDDVLKLLNEGAEKEFMDARRCTALIFITQGPS